MINRSKITLKLGREKSLQRRHPWVFSGAVERVAGSPDPGATVWVENADGHFLAWGAWSPSSQIRVRIWNWQENESIDDEFFRKRLSAALQFRQTVLPDSQSNARRLVHGEADGLPGLIVDQYGEVLVLQCLSVGTDQWRDTLVGLLNELTECTAIYERSDAEVRKLEGLEPRRGLLSGTLPEPPQITEQGLTLEVDVEKGQKTGLYLDQRDNRERVRTLASGKRVLDAFCYTGGFTLAALQGGAESVTAIESSKPALALVEQHCRMNGFEDRDITLVEADVFEHLRRLRDAVATFDLIILDPPKFAPTAKHAEKASRAYKDINLWAFRLLAPGGLLLTCSCSAGVGPALFRKVIGSAALDAGVEGRVIEVLGPAPDHAGALHFPEGEYLTGLLVRRT